METIPHLGTWTGRNCQIHLTAMGSSTTMEPSAAAVCGGLKQLLVCSVHGRVLVWVVMLPCIMYGSTLVGLVELLPMR